jgi:hypothetical protein
VAEELAFEQGVGNRTAVHGDEPVRGPRAVVVDGARDKFLPGAALPLNQHGGPTARDASDEFEDLDHFLALADQRGGPRAFTERTMQRPIVFDQAPVLDGARHGEHQLVEIHRFGDVIVSPLFHRLDRRIDGAERRQQHDGRLRHGLAKRIQQIQTGTGRHADVAQDGVIRDGRGLAQSLGAVTGDIHLKADVT